MARFKKRPIVIDAVLWSGHNLAEITSGVFSTMDYDVVDDVFRIITLEGTMIADYGDWIIRGVKGEFYPCKPDIFALTYESVDVG